ncbi:MAG: hypothetical protein Salg2KO_06280 [Salibacteraceae bacterium]
MKQIITLGLILATISSSIAQSTRTVLLETSESTKTAASAEILCFKKDLKAQFDADELAVMSYHIDNIQFGGDPLYNTLAAQYGDIFSVAFGAGSIDRVSYDGLTVLTDFAEQQWADTIAARINRPTDAKVTVPEVLYDPAYDSIFVRTNIRFTDSTFGIIARDMRFFLFVVQDGFIAEQAFETPRPCNIYPNVPQFIDTSYLVNGNDTIDTFYLEGAQDITHNDVPVLCPTGFTGVKNVISPIIEVGNQWDNMQKFKKPEGVALGNLRVVAFVANFDGNDPTKNSVINVAQSSTFTVYDQDNVNDDNHPDNPDNPNSRLNRDNWANGIENVESPDLNITVSPNPISALGIVEYNLPKTSEVEVSLINNQGQIVRAIYNQKLSSGLQKAAFSAGNLPSGVYHVRIQTDDAVDFAPIVIAH